MTEPVTGYAFWLKADALALNDSDVVTTWTDSSGNGRDFTQGTAANKPLYKANIINAFPVVRFDGSNDYLRRTQASWPTGLSGTFFLVIKFTSLTDAFFFDSRDAGSARHVRFVHDATSNPQRVIVRQRENDTEDAVQSQQLLSAGVWYVLEVGSTGTAFYGQVNGTVLNFTVSTGANSGDWFDDTTLRDHTDIGALGGSLPLNGDIAEVLYYTPVLTADQRQQTRNYLGQKYAIDSAASPQPTNLTSGTDNTQQTSYTTASVTPTANRLQLLSVYSTKATGPATEPTVTGNSLTWVKVRTTTFNTDDTSRLTVFRALGASPTAGVITIDFGGVEQTGATWSLTEFSNVNQSGSDGAGAIIQHASAVSSGTQTDLTVTLAAINNKRNVTYGAFGYIDNAAVTPGSGYTELHEVQDTLPDRTLQTEYQIGKDNTVNVTGGPSVADEGIAGIALELRVVGQGVQVTKLTSDTDSTDGSSFTTGTFTPSANALILASIYNSKASAADLPTLTGCNLTWVQVATSTHGTGASERVTLFRAMSTEPAPGAVTIDYAGANQLACEWSITEFNDVVTSGEDGADAVVQSVTSGGGTGTQTTLTATLAAFADATNNVAFGVFGVNADNAITPGAGFTEIHEVRNATETETLQTQSRTGEDLSVDASWTSAVPASAIALEIAKDDTSALPTVPVATTTTITSDTPDPSTVGAAYTVSWTVVAADPDAGTITGTVTVSDGTDSCNAAVGAGSCSLTSTTAGAKTLTATYSGDATFAASNDTESHTVTAPSGGPILPVSGGADLRVRQVTSGADRLVKVVTGTPDRTVDVVDSGEDLTVQVVEEGNVDFTITVVGGNLD